MVDALSNHLCRKPLQDLVHMSEAVFQAILDVYLEDNNHNYYPQLTLITDYTKPTAARSGAAQPVAPEPAGHGRFGFLDTFLGNFSTLHPRRVIAMELKYVSLYALLRADKFPTHGAFLDASKDWESHELTCQQLGQDLFDSSIEDLRGKRFRRFHRAENQLPAWEEVITVGTVLEKAKDQLQSYIRAIVSGTASAASNGIARRENRIKVLANGTDDIVGMIVCGVGPRVIILAFDTEKTAYQFSRNPNWKPLFHPR